MDLRIKRTRQNIINAFIQLRSQKSLEKISIKELAELATINKATFYKHYKDIYDLSDQLEKELMQNLFNEFQHAEELLTNTKEAFSELCEILIRQSALFDIVFEGDRHDKMIDMLESELEQRICSGISDVKQKGEIRILVSVLVQGTFRTALKYKNGEHYEQLLEMLGDINDKIVKQYQDNHNA